MGALKAGKSPVESTGSSSSTSSKGGLSIVLGCLLVFIVSGAVFLSSLNGKFVYDDDSAVRDNKDIRPETPYLSTLKNDFWGYPMNDKVSHKSYRPVVVLTMRLNYYLHKLDVWGYHVFNVLLHAVTSSLFTYILSRPTLFNSVEWATIAGLLFAVHPVHCDCVASVVGRGEMLAAIFFLLSFQSYINSITSSGASSFAWLICTSVFSFVAMLSKEQGLTVLGICIGFDLLLNISLFSANKRQSNNKLLSAPGVSMRLLTILVTLAGALYFRGWIMAWAPPAFRTFENIIPHLKEKSHRILATLYVWPLNALLLLWPQSLACDWTGVPLPTEWTDSRVLASVGTIAFVALNVLSSLSKLLSQPRGSASTINLHEMVVSQVENPVFQALFGFGLMIGTFLPASHIFFHAGFIVAERVLYLPSMGFCILLALACRSLYQSALFNSEQRRNESSDGGSGSLFSVGTKQLFFWAVLLVPLYLLGARTWSRNMDWATPTTLLKADVSANPNSGRMQVAYCGILHSQHKDEESLPHCEAGVRLSPEDSTAHANLCGTLQRLQTRTPEAEGHCRKAVQLDPNNANAWGTFCGFSLQVGKFKEGEEQCKKSLSMNPKAVGINEQMCAVIAAQQNPDKVTKEGLRRLAEAEEYCKKGAEITPDAGSVYSNWCGMLIVARRFEEAEKMCIKAQGVATAEGGDDSSARSNLVVMLWQSGRHEEAAKQCREGLRKYPKNGSFATNLCMMSGALKQFEAQIKDCEYALKVAPSDQNVGNYCIAWKTVNPSRPDPYGACRGR